MEKLQPAIAVSSTAGPDVFVAIGWCVLLLAGFYALAIRAFKRVIA